MLSEFLEFNTKIKFSGYTFLVNFASFNIKTFYSSSKRFNPRWLMTNAPEDILTFEAGISNETPSLIF